MSPGQQLLKVANGLLTFLEIEDLSPPTTLSSVPCAYR